MKRKTTVKVKPKTHYQHPPKSTPKKVAKMSRYKD